jgi:hypothetical protein
MADRKHIGPTGELRDRQGPDEVWPERQAPDRLGPSIAARLYRAVLSLATQNVLDTQTQRLSPLHWRFQDGVTHLYGIIAQPFRTAFPPAPRRTGRFLRSQAL